MTKKKIILIIAAVAPTLLVLAALIYIKNPLFRASTSPQSLEKAQSELIEYASQNHLKDKEVVYHGSSKLCSSSSGEQSSCTLSSTYVYRLEGNYRDNGKEIFAYLKQRGFDFRSNSKYKTSVPQKLNDETLNDNLSNSTPIIVDLYNDNPKTRVRVSLGDRGRISSYTPATGQPLDDIDDKQLIARLQFYRP